MMNYRTKNWVVGILIGSWVATFIVGYLHGAELLSEPHNPLVHTFRDWLIMIVVLLPLTLVVVRVMGKK